MLTIFLNVKEMQSRVAVCVGAMTCWGHVGAMSGGSSSRLTKVSPPLQAGVSLKTFVFVMYEKKFLWMI